MLADLIARGAGVVHQEILCGYQHSGSTETALKCVALMEFPLQLGELSGVRQSLDRFDLPPFGLYGQHQASADDLAIDADCAGSARPVLAAHARSGKPEIFAQKINQVLACRYAARNGLAVYDERCFNDLFHG